MEGKGQVSNCKIDDSAEPEDNSKNAEFRWILHFWGEILIQF